MSFIDYNFFPILFFLGWNILTIKQFRPNTYNTVPNGGFKTLPGLSVFSLEGSLLRAPLFLMNQKQGPGRIFERSKMRMLKQGPITNSTNQKALQSYRNHPKTSHILEFIPEFRCLSENQKLIILPQTNIICSKNRTKEESIFPPGADKFFNNSLLPSGPFFGGADPKGDSFQQIKHGKKQKQELKHQILTIYRKEKFIINYIPKPTKLVIKEDRTHYFTNHSLINNNWKKDFKSNLFNFAYRPRPYGGKTFLSFFSPTGADYKIKPIFPEIESLINSAYPFYKRGSARTDKIETHSLVNFESGSLLTVGLKNPAGADSLSIDDKFLNQYENDIFFNGLCFSQNNISFSAAPHAPKKSQKPLQRGSYTWFLNKVADPQANSFLTPSNSNSLKFDGEITPSNELDGEIRLFGLNNQMKNGSILKKRDLNHKTFSTTKLSSYQREPELDKQKTRPYLLHVFNTRFIKNNDYDHNSSRFKSSFVCIKVNAKKLNKINWIEKRRAKMRLLLRVSNQNIYSLNQFQIPLCFSKIFKPPISFNDCNSRFNLASWFSKSMENKDLSIVKTFVFDHFFNTGFLKLNNSEFNIVKNEFESQNSFSRTSVLGGSEHHHNSFVKSNQENDYVDNYKKRKKNWYMKTQFFQYIAWNMKHNILDHFSNFEYLLRKNDLSVKNNDFEPDGSKSSDQNKKSSLNKHYFSEEPKKTLHGYTICQNYFLRMYAGSWYYENLAFPYSIFSTINKTPLLPLHSNSIFNWWQDIFFKQKNITAKEKSLQGRESKRVAIMWLYTRQPNSLESFSYWPYQNQLEYNQAILSSTYANRSEGTSKNQTQFLACQRIEGSAEKKLSLSNDQLNNSQALPIVLPQAEPWGKTQNYKKDPFFEKSQIRLESDIGIYSLAHKLSSVGFRNGNNSSKIYPWRYNDSYRYNFQNMNLLNQGLKNFLGFSDFKNQSLNPSVFSRKTTNAEQSFTTDKTTYFLNFKKFLDFQNPIFSKIYAPIFQPQGLNLLSFITNSFLNVIPNSVLNTKSMTFFGLHSIASSGVKQHTKPKSFRQTKETLLRGSFFLPDQIQPTSNDYPHYLASAGNSVDVQNTPKKFTMVNSLYNKLPINGIHINPYPWITQNAFDRWSTSDSLCILSDSSFFSRKYSGRDKFLNPSVTNYHRVKKNTHPSGLTKSVNMGFPTLSQKVSLKNSNSQLHFTEKASCIKKPSIFFSSFRYLPYFFISETPSARLKLHEKNFFPQANLSLFSLVDSTNYQLKKPVISPSNSLERVKNLDSNLSITQYNLFNNNILKKNQKKQILKTWKDSLQHKFFSLKPLSTFVKKEFGYQTSLLSLAPKASFKSNTAPARIFRANYNSIQKTNLVPIQKNTWKVFPPLFQPLTFRFIDLNLPRTWSSELLTLRFNNSFLKTSEKDQQKIMLLDRNKSKFRHAVDLSQNTKVDSGSLPHIEGRTDNPLKIDYQFLNPSCEMLFDQRVDRKPLSAIDHPFKTSTPNFWEKIGTRSSFWKKNKADTLKKKKRFKPFGSNFVASFGVKQQAEPNILPQNLKWNVTQKNFFRFSLPFYFSDFFRFPVTENNQFNTKHNFTAEPTLRGDYQNKENTEFYESIFPLTNISQANKYKQLSNNDQNHRFAEKKNSGLIYNETKFPVGTDSKIVVYAEKPLLKNRTPHGPPLKNQKESISLPNYLKNITNQNYQNLCPNNLNELYSVFWILFNKTLFIYLSLYYLRKFISFLGTEYIRNLFKIFVTMKFIDGNILSIIKTFQDFNFQLNQQNVIDIKVNKQLKEIKRS